MTNEEKNFTKRFNDLKNELNTAQAMKSIKETDIKKLKNEHETLKTQCLDDFGCEPKNLKSKIIKLENELNTKLEEAEKLLEKLSENES